MAIHEKLLVTESQLQVFKDACYTRAFRDRPEVLLVEDQLFSIKLMHGVLTRDYKLHTAMNAKDGFYLYLESAPDIVMLDIQLPEINGHQLAEAINEVDPGAFIVMVTGSHAREDVEQAKHNRTKAFVTKPYSKKKILDCIDLFILEHPDRKFKKT